MMIKRPQSFSEFIVRLRFSKIRNYALLVVDGLIAVFCLWLAIFLRFEGEVPEAYLRLLSTLLPLIFVSRIAANALLHLHRWSFLFSGLRDGLRLLLAGLLGSGFFLLLIFFLRIEGTPRSTVALEFFLSTFLIGFLRFSPRVAWMYIVDWRRSREKNSQRTLIIGAGAAGEMLLRDLQRSQDHHFKVVGLLDDDERKTGSFVGGRRVLGRIEDLPLLVPKYKISNVLIAIPRLPATRVREILSLCVDLSLRFKILPVSFMDHALSTSLKDVTPEDLLPREPIRVLNDDELASISGRTVLVTGASGSIGSEICRQLLGAGVQQLIMLDMNENTLYLQHREFESGFPMIDIRSEIADIRDATRLMHLIAHYRPQDIFHTAAHKHVPLLEQSPAEAVKNNILGTWNTVQAAEAAHVDRFVYISTDKAVRPTSVMGASKRVGEIIIRKIAQHSSVSYRAVRFGNVLGSSGSVVPLFQNQISAGGPVTVTHPDVRRYFMTISEAVGLVLKAGYNEFGDLCVLDMGEQIRIYDLARLLIIMNGKSPEIDIPIIFTGLRPGEKLMEQLITEEEELTQKVHSKILTVTCKPLQTDIQELIEQFRHVALTEDSRAVIRTLALYVPSYRPFENSVTIAKV